jgi:ABC-type branched-subunit amino acid transport system ATPase component
MLEVSELPSAYGRIEVLKGVAKTIVGNLSRDVVSLTVKPREIVAIVGSNGAGKTTLLRTSSVRCTAGADQLCR